MYWSVHQYQKPIMAEPGSTASQGKDLSLRGRTRWMLVPTAVNMACQPETRLPWPMAERPMNRMKKEPRRRTGVWSREVYMMTRMPPTVV